MLQRVCMKIAVCFKLKHLNISWCEELTSAGLETVGGGCPELETLAMRQCLTTPTAIDVITGHCTSLRVLDLSGVNCIDDFLLVRLAAGLRRLETLDISWNIGEPYVYCHHAV